MGLDSKVPLTVATEAGNALPPGANQPSHALSMCNVIFLLFGDW